MIDTVREFNTLGFATFPTRGKIPHKDCAWKEIEPSPFLDESAYRDQYAVRLRPTDLIIDIDPRNFPKGSTRNVWKELKAKYKLDGIETRTFVVQTGGGGYHIWLKKPAGLQIRKSLPEFPGIDFLGATADKARYVIGPGSTHDSGRQYKVHSGSPDAIIDAPVTLLSDIERKEKAGDDEKAKDGKISDDPQNIARYIEYLKEYAPKAIQGQNGDETTFKAACRGRDFGLSPLKVHELMLTHYNPLCTPAWSADDLKVKVANAYKYNTEPIGKRAPETAFKELRNQYDPLAYDRLFQLDKALLPQLVTVNSKSVAMPILKNAVIFLTLKPTVHTALRYNMLSHGVEVVGQLPWHSRRSGKEWGDNDTTHCKYYLAEQYKVEFTTNTILEAAYIIAARTSYHPVREYLDRIVWDGTPRLDKWLTTYCGVADCLYTQTVGRKTLVAAIARVYDPGCKFDHVLILEGKQRIGKSLTCAILGGEWFGDFNVDPGNKDTVDAMRGKWIIELPEMSVVRRKRDVEELKAFITRTVDRVRFAYARTTSDCPRQSVFIGTVNPDNVGYLTDRTGNGRFWPVLCTKIDLEGLKRDRDQILAEARERYKEGEKLYIEDLTLRAEAEARADERVEEDPWIEIISGWNAGLGREVNEITTTAIYENVLNGVAKNITRLDQIRIGKALSACGWFKHRTSQGNIYSRGAHDPYPEVSFK